MNLIWKKYTIKTMDEALGNSYCLYVFHNPRDRDRPFYIGKAKFFGTKQPSGYKRTARYNSGYVHLVAGLLRSGFSLYIASLGETAFAAAESYEQELIALWNPIRKQKVTRFRQSVVTTKPWSGC